MDAQTLSMLLRQPQAVVARCLRQDRLRALCTLALSVIAVARRCCRTWPGVMCVGSGSTTAPSGAWRGCDRTR